jgi:hypothetical protein
MIGDYLRNNVDTFTHDKNEINADINHLWKNDGIIDYLFFLM